MAADMMAHPWAALGASWGTDGPRLRVRAGDTVADVPLIGAELRYRATGTRVCLGHPRMGGGSTDCIELPTTGDRRCESCRIRAARFAANLHHSHTRPRNELSAEALRHLSKPNRLYIAVFRDGSTKVGTSTAARLDTRLTEQGAWRACVVADADDGFAVREIEDLVTEFLSVPQSVSVRRKLAGMLSPVDDVRLDALLARTADDVRHLIDRTGDDRLISIDERWVSRAASSPLWSGVHEYPFPLHAGDHHVVVDGAHGRLVALRRPGHGDDMFVADIGELFGVVVEPGEYETAEIAIQDSLF